MRPPSRPPKPKIRWLSYMMIVAVMIIMAGHLGLAAAIVVCTWAEVIS